MRVTHGHAVAAQPQHVGQRVAQRIDALGVRPDRQLPVAKFRQRAGRRHRRVRHERPRIGRAAPPCRSIGWWIRRRRRNDRRMAASRTTPPPAAPASAAGTLSHVACAGAAAAARCTTVSSAPTNATKLPTRTMRKSPRAARRTAASSSDTRRRAARRLAQNARVQHVRPHHVVDERGAADLGRQVAPRHRLAHDLVSRGRLRRRACLRYRRRNPRSPAKFQ